MKLAGELHDISDRSRRLPAIDQSNFLRVHLDASRGDDESVTSIALYYDSHAYNRSNPHESTGFTPVQPGPTGSRKPTRLGRLLPSGFWNL